MIFVPIIKKFYISAFGFKMPVLTYFLMSLIGYLLGLIFIAYEIRRKKLNIKEAFFGFCAAFIGITIGSRLFFYFLPWWSYDRTWTLGERFLRFIDVFNTPGMVFYGGLVGAIIAVWIYFKARDLNFWRYMDAYAPALFIGYAFGRIGCFLTNDTCRGMATDLPWGVVREAGHPAIHPTQLYSTIVALIIFVVLWRLRKQQHFDGWLALIGLMAYASTRFFIEFFRAYSFKLLGIFSPSHIISVIIFAFALWIFIKKSNEEKSIKPKARK